MNFEKIIWKTLIQAKFLFKFLINLNYEKRKKSY